ncbi:MAG: prepilin peptidase [Phycisphaeraceae bacterium]|nr:prepilin peptidase [Phycisphaeraceae bacterium]
MLELIAFCLLAVVLLIAAVSDVRRGVVPNKLTYPAALAGLLLWTVGGWWTGLQWSGLWLSLAGLASALIPYALAYAIGGLGGGDVKLMAALGAIAADWRVVLSATVYALIVAVIFAGVLMVRHRIIKRTLSRLLGAVLMIASKTRPEIPTDSPRVPFALTIALGGLLAAAEQMLGLWTPWAWLNP